MLPTTLTSDVDWTAHNALNILWLLLLPDTVTALIRRDLVAGPGYVIVLAVLVSWLQTHRYLNSPYQPDMIVPLPRSFSLQVAGYPP